MSSADLAANTIRSRTVEAVLQGMPTVNFDFMYQAMVREVQGGWNQIVYWSGLPDWKDQTGGRNLQDHRAILKCFGRSTSYRM